SYPLRLDTSGKMASLLVMVEENQLGLDWPDRFKAGIAKVTAADVKRVAAVYMDPAPFSSVTVKKEAPPIPGRGGSACPGGPGGAQGRGGGERLGRGGGMRG